jgi:hypothetical protein
MFNNKIEIQLYTNVLYLIIIIDKRLPKCGPKTKIESQFITN